MSRVKREILDGGVYHILKRGHNKDNLFKEPNDFRTFKEIIKRYKDKYDFDLYNYYVKSERDDIITTNPLYETLAKTPKERRETYIRYLLEPRSYEQLLDEKIASLK